MLKAKFKNNYRTEEGVLRAAYLVSGTPEELAAYKIARNVDGDFYKEDDDGKPLWTTGKVVPPTVNLAISKKSGRVYVDTSEEDRIAILCQQYPGPLGHALAQAGAKHIFDKMLGKTQDEPEVEIPVTKPGESLEQ
jgi:hypothetical protein